MISRALPRLVWIAPAILLCIALAHLPYGFYTLLRIVTCGAAGLLAYVAYEQSKRLTGWVAALCVVALVFNPVILVYFPRSVWMYVDVGTASLFIAHMLSAPRS